MKDIGPTKIVSLDDERRQRRWRKRVQQPMPQLLNIAADTLVFKPFPPQTNTTWEESLDRLESLLKEEDTASGTE